MRALKNYYMQIWASIGCNLLKYHSIWSNLVYAYDGKYSKFVKQVTWEWIIKMSNKKIMRIIKKIIKT